MARITAGVTTSHVPAIGATIDHGRRPSPTGRPMFAGYDFSKRWMAQNTPDVVDPRLQRPAPPRSASTSCRHSRSAARALSAGRRRLGAAARARRPGPPGARGAHRAVRHPAGLRPDLRLQDGRRSRADRAAVAPLRPARRMAVPGHPAGRQRRFYPPPSGNRCYALARRSARGRVLRRGPQRADLGEPAA